ncbi:MAG: hypothetical protein CMG41_01655 [Candidatus Marinimicrobia bacterium]|nr:hypothetical protein [Candidatus Neomarinimicrobiota bacterium]
MKNFIFIIVFISKLFTQIDYTTQIQPIFNDNCTSCHVNGGTYSGGLDLSSYAETIAGGSSGNTVVPLDHSNSLLYNRITLPENNPQFMPKNDDPLNQSDIDLIIQWIDEGALETPAVEYSGPVWYIATTGSDETGDGSEQNPYATIQKGVNVATELDTVYVSNGIYDGGIVITDKVISLIGESREETKLNQPISLPQISIIGCQTDTTRVKNFNVAHGSSADGGGIYSSESIVEIDNIDFYDNFSSNKGGAINSNESTVIVQNSTFNLNSCNSLGGAIYVDALSICKIYNSVFTSNGAWNGGAIATVGGGKLLIRGSRLSYNTAIGYNPSPDQDYPTFGGGGGIYQEWSDGLEIYDSEISNNNATNAPGGGIAIYLSDDIIIDNIILNNNSSNGGGGGVMFLRTDNVLFENSTIANNISTNNSGGGIFIGSESGLASIVINATFNRLSIFNNHAMSGGGIFCWSAILNLYHSTIAQNTATDNDWSGGGLASHYVTRPNIINSLFYGNVPNSIKNGYQQTPVLVSYSLVQEQWAGDGNLIGVDPLFANIGDQDFSLQLNSPCIDAGTADIDQDGIDEITEYYGSAPDMGAYEILNMGLTDFGLASNYVTPLTDSMSISTYTFGEVVAQSVTAKINDIVTGDQVEIDLVENSGAWSGHWIPQTESFFNVDLQMNDDNMFTYENVASFTSVGPVNVNLTGDLMVGPNTVNLFTFALENNSLSQDISDLSVSFLPRSDACIQTMTGTAFQFDNLALGDMTDSQNLVVATNFNCAAGTLILIDAQISSGGTLYWEDNIILTMDALGVDQGGVPTAYRLSDAYPNPFNPMTKFNYEVPNTEHVSIDIYNLTGRHIKSLVNSIQNPGYKTVQWNATNDRNEPVSGGLYLYTIESGDFKQTKKMLLLK